MHPISNPFDKLSVGQGNGIILTERGNRLYKALRSIALLALHGSVVVMSSCREGGVVRLRRHRRVMLMLMYATAVFIK